MTIVSWEFESPPLHFYRSKLFAEIAQLVEHDLAKVGVAGPSPVFRSTFWNLQDGSFVFEPKWRNW